MHIEQSKEAGLIAAILDDTREGSRAIERATAAGWQSSSLESARAVLDGQYGGGSTKERRDWYGVDTHAAALHAIEHGWNDGAARLSALECTAPDIQSTRRRRVRGDQGDELDAQSVLRGDLSRAWTRTRRLSRHSPRIVRILCNVGGASKVTAAELYWRGATALRAVETLEAAGLGVELWAGSGSKRTSSGAFPQVGVFCCIKSSDTPLDVSRLAGLIALPAWFRTEALAARAYACHVAGQAIADCFGLTDDAALLDAARLLGLTADAYISRAVLSQSSAQAWLTSELPAALTRDTLAA